MTDTTGMKMPINPIDEIPPIPNATVLGLQHVLILYAGAITVPIIVGSALGLNKEQLAFLINADLFCCGIVSIIQSLGIGKFVGIRLPVMMGVSFAGIAPIITIGLTPDFGLPGLYGSIIGAGILCFLLTPLIVKGLFLFPPVVTGTTLVTLGIGLLGVAANWVGGGFGVEDFGNPVYLSIALLVIVTILVVTRFGKGFLSNMSVILGILIGTLAAFMMGMVDFAGVDEAPWVDIVRPFHFGLPTFHFIPILTMSIIVLITMIESIGMLYALGEILEKNISENEFKRGLRADAMGAMIGGIFNTFPYTSYAQNIGLVGITNARSRFICVAAGVILIGLALLPKLASVVASIPHFVLGAAALVMFGMVVGSGIRILSRVDWRGNRYNGFIFAISLGVGMLPTLSHDIFSHFPQQLEPLLHSGVILSATTAIILNLLFDHRSGKTRQSETMKATF